MGQLEFVNGEEIEWDSELSLEKMADEATELTGLIRKDPLAGLAIIEQLEEYGRDMAPFYACLLETVERRSKHSDSKYVGKFIAYLERKCSEYLGPEKIETPRNVQVRSPEEPTTDYWE